ncbi:flagellar hook-associated protein 3 [Desulfonatronospira thiodismutans ASO3-1]|uniref:Flagellar hook-associated protein 3 n=1 Tax=Desulfonatronospira thiodismutans ASO3-1 TaxID=555779 RepID=D6SR81_9BACT|nr:flagellar hook-associated protein FlgL [Desulfonatronospira thiodismutans]EFI33197.1 flagellar hook-associated protein 3 [Desulfonatronospira thiodismutans ASO3-1]
MRVSHSMMYDNFMQNMNRSTTELMELNKQASSQKKVNKPSDDPVGMSRILGYRDSISALDQYQSNVDTAKGWLNLADETLMQASNLLIRAKELAEQGATGTLSPEQREILAGEVEQVFDQMLNLANTRYEGKSIFAGHKTDGSAFEKLEKGSVESNQDQLPDKLEVADDDTGSFVSGHLNEGVKVTFSKDEEYTLDPDKIVSEKGTDSERAKLEIDLGYPPPAGFKINELNLVDEDGSGINLEDSGFDSIHALVAALSGNDYIHDVEYIDSGEDKGKLIIYGDSGEEINVSGDFTLTEVTYQLETMDGKQISEDPQRLQWDEDRDAYKIQFSMEDDEENEEDQEQITIRFDPDFDPLDSGQISFDEDDDPKLWFMPTRPAVEYKGDDEDTNNFSVYAEKLEKDDVEVFGSFDKNVNLRIDKKIDEDGNVEGEDADYSGGDLARIEYSYSLDGGSTWNEGNTTTNNRFMVPGGRVEVEDDLDRLSTGDQINIRPHKASINFEISAGDNIQVNGIGKDIFGGIYKNSDGEYVKDPEGPENVFETLGELIGYLENDDEEGIQRSLANIDDTLKHISSELASVGARENRLDVASTVLSGLEHNEKERLSKIEDVDVAELMSRLMNQQMTYEAVLRSSSMIMQMSLVNHL